MRRILAFSLAAVLMTASSARAADQEGTGIMSPAVTAAAVVLAPHPETAAAAVQFTSRSWEPKRPKLLPALYGMSGFLQGYDTYSTLNALKHGAVEANPVMKGVTKSPMAFIGLKAGVTTLSILAAERMWKNHNRIGAIATMVVSNGLMTAVAANNARVLSRVK